MIISQLRDKVHICIDPNENNAQWEYYITPGPINNQLLLWVHKSKFNNIELVEWLTIENIITKSKVNYKLGNTNYTNVMMFIFHDAEHSANKRIVRNHFVQLNLI